MRNEALILGVLGIFLSTAAIPFDAVLVFPLFNHFFSLGFHVSGLAITTVALMVAGISGGVAGP